MKDSRFKVDEIFSNLVDKEPKIIIMLVHNKRYVYRGGASRVLIYYTDSFGFLHYTIVPVHYDDVRWQHCKIFNRTIEDDINRIFTEYKREG